MHFQNGPEARLSKDTELWRRSGLADVDRHLVEFLAGEKSQALRDAVRRKAADVVADVLTRLEEAIAVLAEIQIALTGG